MQKFNVNELLGHSLWVENKMKTKSTLFVIITNKWLGPEVREFNIDSNQQCLLTIY